MEAQKEANKLNDAFQKAVREQSEYLRNGDPNSLTGPTGFGPNSFIPPTQTLPYTISFANEPTADIPVQQVIVTEQLDPNLDWTTFQVGDFNISGTTYHVPANSGSYSTRLDLTSTLGIYLDVTAGINLTTGLATWTFTSIDPTTGDLPSSIFVGFLPPDKNAPAGEAFVTYTVRPKPTDPTGTVIQAQATVVFDTNAPIKTNIVTNTIDAGPPTSSVSPLPGFTPAQSFTVTWSGSDDPGGSGIATYDIFVSDNGGLFAPFLQGTTLTSATFTGQIGHTYGFYSVATDNVGNHQATPTAAQAVTTVVNGNDLQGTSLALTAGGAPNFGGPVALFTDPDQSGSLASYSATIAWGDGATSTGLLTTNGGGSYTVSGSHTYLRSAVYNVSVQITDASDGGSLTVISTADFSAPLHPGPPPAHLLDVAKALTTSAEYYTNVITAAYQRYLGRAPDAAGLASWVSQMQQGLSDEHLEAGFIGSAEYIQNHGGTGAGWVIGMYHDLLGRTPDAAGLNNWLQQLQIGVTPVSIAYGFAASAEREGQRVLADYQRFLARTPAQSEIDFWVDQFVNHGVANEGVMAGFVASAEYFQQHYNDASDWLFGAYQDTLGRPPDPAAVTDWLKVLQGS
jgi:hypothetical protein